MLDTNICIYLMKHHPPEVAKRFAQCYVGEVVISAITLAELEYGVTCSGENMARNRIALASLLEDIVVAPFDGIAAHAYGHVQQASNNRKRDALGKLIAAHAIALNIRLVTNNEADFVAYPGIKIENWVSNH
ncbi:MAG TPA: type II toxin-antitoxin system VapC family toxin [Gallionellaceae bacterium]|nr:type II toxin-antitoxin system VapC family toxin [Gallionellaceae bacterium]